MKDEHTPGPWKLVGRAIDGPDGNVGLLNLARDERSTEANGSLIAAAPDLLAALKDAARDFAIMRMGARMPKWDAAIAKAQGR